MKALLQNEREAKFKTCAENCVQAYSCFWNIMQERLPQFEMFMLAGFEVLACNSLLEKQWEGFRKRKCIPLGSLRLYAMLCDNILEDPNKASEIREFLHEAKETTHDDSLLAYAKNGCAVLTVSGEGEDFGKILKYNLAFSQITEYDPFELSHKPLDLLIPHIYRDSHKKAMLQHFRLSETNLSAITAEKHVFMYTKSRHIIPVIIKIVETPNYVNGYTYVASVILDKDNSIYSKLNILVNNEQEIVSISSSIFQNIIF